MGRNAFFGLILMLFSAVFAYGQEGVFRAVPGEDGVQRAEVTGGSYFFTPNRLVVKVGVPVELRVKKEPGAAPHSIVLKAPEAGIDFAVELAAEPKTVRFTPTKVGTYKFFCDKKLPFFESHREKGMHGLLEVVD